MNIKDGWVAFGAIMLAALALSLGILVGHAQITSDCVNFGAFVSPSGSKYACHKGAP